MKPVKYLILASVSFLVATTAYLFVLDLYASNEKEAPSEPDKTRLLTVSTLPVSIEKSYTVFDQFTGVVEAARRSQLGFELSGTAIEILVDEGDTVQAGALLARLDTSRLDAAMRQQQALVDESKASLQLAQASFDRVSRLILSGAVSTQNLDDARQQKDTAMAALDRATASKDSIQVDLQKSKLVAPYDGQIVARNIDEGTIVNPGVHVLELIESKRNVRIGAPPSLLRKIAVGQKVDLRNRTSGERLVGTITRIVPQQNRRTLTVDVVISLDTEFENILPGELVDWELSTEVEAPGAWLPRTALTSASRGLWAVYATAQPTNLFSVAENVFRLERRQVEVIHISGEKVFVRGALKTGDRALAGGLQRVAPGQHVIDER